MARRKNEVSLAAPYLRRLWLDPALVKDAAAYPFCLPLFKDAFEIEFEHPIMIIVGENGVGKSTLIEGIAALAGYDEAGGGKGYMPVDHSAAIEIGGGTLAAALKAAWRPKITDGWFFKAESFFSVARYMDSVGSQTANFLSHSHGEGFMRFFEERCRRQGIYMFDEPESALSPQRQLDFLKVLERMHTSSKCQVIMATHAPILMAYPGAQLMRLTRHRLERVMLEDIEHFRLMRQFCDDPRGFVQEKLAERSEQ